MHFAPYMFQRAAKVTQSYTFVIVKGLKYMATKNSSIVKIALKCAQNQIYQHSGKLLTFRWLSDWDFEV